MSDDDRTKPAVPPHLNDPPKIQSGPIGQFIQNYRINEKIGEGGMGEVYAAEQTKPVQRKVALKVIKLGMASRDIIARFESERQALALMNHSNIAQVLDAGTTDQEQPFFVMEYVDGVPITECCDAATMNTEERLELCLQVCAGVQHAHQKGIIHRDIKPSNVLVTLQGEKHVPKIIDFGAAKATAQRLTEMTFQTEAGLPIGTPEYMSPEQASGLPVDTRTDVYSLGVLLYELLVGARPFDSREMNVASFEELRQRIRDTDAPRPSTRITSLGEGSTTAAKNNFQIHSGPAIGAFNQWVKGTELENWKNRHVDEIAEKLMTETAAYLNEQVKKL